MRFRRSLIHVAHTWSRAKDNTNSTVTTFAAGETGSGLINVFDPDANYSLSVSDVPHRFVVSYNVDLPSGNNRGWQRLSSGWVVTGLYQWQSGVPLPLTANSPASMFAGANRPNWTGQSAGLDTSESERVPSRVGGTEKWFDTTQFSAPVPNNSSPYALGNTPRTIGDLRGDNVNNLDAGFFKDNRFGPNGRYNLQIRFEVFNLFNDVRFASPGRNVSAPATFGVVTNQLNRPRQMQIAAKFLF